MTHVGCVVLRPPAGFAAKSHLGPGYAPGPFFFLGALYRQGWGV